MHGLRFVDDCTGGVGVAVDVQQLSHGERAEHAARSSQHRDKKRLNADAAEARRDLLVCAHAQAHQKHQRINGKRHELVHEFEFFCVLSQARGQEVAGDHNGPVESEQSHKVSSSFRRGAAKIE